MYSGYLSVWLGARVAVAITFNTRMLDCVPLDTQYSPSKLWRRLHEPQAMSQKLLQLPSKELAGIERISDQRND